MSAWSVSQRLLPNLSEGITWCLPGSTQYLSCLCLSDGFDQCLSELVLTCFFLPISVRRSLLMSIWTELACFLASVCLMSSIGVCLKGFPLLVCQYLFSGATWFLSGFFLKSSIDVFLICCPAFLNSPVWKDWELSANLYLYLFGWFTLYLPELVPKFLHSSGDANWLSFLWFFQDSVSRTIRSPSGLLAHKVFIKTVQVWQLAIKDADRS